MQTRVPYDLEYTARLGMAVYVFAYYEWAVIYLIEQFNNFCLLPSYLNVRPGDRNLEYDPATATNAR